MVLSCIADEHLLSYLHSVAKQNSISIGLILGQSASGKDYVIHFAKTPPFQSADNKDGTGEPPCLKNINDVNEDWVADHARQATRTLPGGMHVLGIFLTTGEDLLNPFSPKIKGVLNKIYKSLDSNKYLYGSPNANDKIVLNYCTKTQQYSSKAYNISTTSVTPADFKFLTNATKWAQLECKYQMEQVYHIEANESDWPLKKHMAIILNRLNDSLKSAIFLFDGEIKDSDECIESFNKKKKLPRNSKSGGQEENLKPLQVCILQPCDLKEKSDLFEISDSGNQIRIFGHIVCKLWVNPKFTIKDASDAIIEDIMRSFSTRLEMHWDSLTEEEHGEDMNSVHEPPRRVLVPLPNSKIAISDYLFPGEGAQDAQISLEEMLDIKIHHEDDVMDVEGQADLTDYYNDNLESESEEIVSKKPIESNKTLYIIGVAVAFLVLVISLLIHFIQG